MKLAKTTIDELWSLLFSLIIVASSVGCALLAALYLTPALIGSPRGGGSRHGIEALVAFVALFGGLFLGILIATQVIASLTRRYADTATQARLEQRSQESIAFAPAPVRRFLQFFIRLARP